MKTIFDTIFHYIHYPKGRLKKESASSQEDENTPLSLPVTRNLVVMITVAFKGEEPDLETNFVPMKEDKYF